MPYTLQQLLVDAYEELGQLTVSTATGGTTSTVVDSKQVGRHGDDAWKDGAAFLIRDAGGSNAAPEGEMAFLTAYTDSSGTFTSASSSWTVAPASGDTFGFVNDFFPFHTMIELCNRALQGMGEVPSVDTTTLDSAASQTEYTYAIAWKQFPPYRVDLQTKTNDANDNRWVEISDWEYVPAAGGSTALLVLPQLPTSRDIRIWYRGIHPTLASASDNIYEGFPRELVVATCVEKALNWQNSRLQGGDEFLKERWNIAVDKLDAAEAKYKTWRPPQRNRILVLGNEFVDENDFTEPAPA